MYNQTQPYIRKKASCTFICTTWLFSQLYLQYLASAGGVAALYAHNDVCVAQSQLYLHDLGSGARLATFPLDIGSIVGYSGKTKDTEVSRSPAFK